MAGIFGAMKKIIPLLLLASVALVIFGVWSAVARLGLAGVWRPGLIAAISALCAYIGAEAIKRRRAGPHA
jgi:hypothetical protein